jgi:hypothetical protein
MSRQTSQGIFLAAAFVVSSTLAAVAQVVNQVSPFDVVPPSAARTTESGTLNSALLNKFTPFPVVAYDAGSLKTFQMNKSDPNKPFTISLQPPGTDAPQQSNAAAVQSVWDAPAAIDWLALMPKDSPSILQTGSVDTKTSFDQPSRNPPTSWQQSTPPSALFSKPAAPAQDWNTSPDSPTKGIKYEWK